MTWSKFDVFPEFSVGCVVSHLENDIKITSKSKIEFVIYKHERIHQFVPFAKKVEFAT